MSGARFTTGLGRREFLRVSAAGVAGLAFAPLLRGEGPRASVEAVAIEARQKLFRVLQVTDTSFGVSTSEGHLRDRWTRHLISRLVEEQKPDFVVHTGDFLDQSQGRADLEGVKFMDDLGVAWALTPGNRDRSEEQRDGVERVLAEARRCATRALPGAHGGTSFVFRVDVREGQDGEAKGVMLGFDTGGFDGRGVVGAGIGVGRRRGEARVDAGQLAWLREQKLPKGAVVLAFQHIPLRQFHDVAQSERTQGQAGEPVHFGDDDGTTFDAYRAARVRGIFCGHDHANDFSGELDGVTLAYGRVSGWTGYGSLQRGGRLIELDLAAGAFTHRVVLPRGIEDCGATRHERESVSRE